MLLFRTHRVRRPGKLVFALVLLCGLLLGILAPAPPATSAAYLVQAESAAAAAAAVTGAGGVVTRHLELIDGVAATLDPAALARLRANPRLALHLDRSVQASGSEKETDTAGYLLYPAAATGAHLLHDLNVPTPRSECRNQQVAIGAGQESRPLRGWGVTVAVIDTGFMKMKHNKDWDSYDAATDTLYADERGRCIVYRDFLPSKGNKNKNNANSEDENGHGTHVIATIADRYATPLAEGRGPSPVGVAPDVNLMIARVLDRDGAGSYADVIAAIEWIIANKDRYNVRVLNLSLYAPVTGPYWADPLNQAVMKAWQAGIVVVVAAGNAGPEAGTITAPGNVPYVITVGAIRSGRYTESGDDELAAYSSRGPTESAFIKPDLVIPATRTIAPMAKNARLGQGIPQARIQVKDARVDFGIGEPATGHTYYQLSGTSMAAPQVSGIVALMLQANPALTNDQVKYRLLDTARLAIDQTTGQPVYSVWEQGAGLVNAYGAVFADSVESANAGMDIALDLQVFDDGRDEVHYWGNTEWDEATGEFRLVDPETGAVLQVWDGGFRTWSGGFRTWSGGFRTWSGGFRTWSGGFRTWSGGFRTWSGSDASLWAGSNRCWVGATAPPALTTTSHGETLLNEYRPISDAFFTVALPMVLR